jgi:hypothetical protein
MIKTVLCCITILGLAALSPAQEKKSGVLHPEMKVADDAGTDAAPMGKIGQKSDQPWSSTTIAAGVDKKPEPGKPVTVTGEIIDMSCYLQLGKHGKAHVPCGTKCLKAGAPIGLVTKNGTIYMLMEEEHDPRRDGQTSAFRTAATQHLGHIMEVSGTEASHGGYNGLFVQGYVSK